MRLSFLLALILLSTTAFGARFAVSPDKIIFQDGVSTVSLMNPGTDSIVYSLPGQGLDGDLEPGASKELIIRDYGQDLEEITLSSGSDELRFELPVIRESPIWIWLLFIPLVSILLGLLVWLRTLMRGACF